MNASLVSDFFLLLPEITLAILALALQLFGVMGHLKTETICKCALICLGLIIYMTIKNSDYEGFGFGESYMFNGYTVIYKTLVLACAFLVIATYIGYKQSLHQEFSSEYIVILLLALVGACIAISALDLIVLFMGLELQAHAGYVLASFDRDNVKSSEAGLKYFVLGALASCIMLFGMSFLYGFSGSTSYIVIARLLAMPDPNIGLVVGAMLLLIGIMFKMSAVPFHMWTPDVYEGAPLTSVSFFASAQKLAAASVLISITSAALLPFGVAFAPVIKIIAISSMIVGSIGALSQESIKRLMAYSTILNVGFALISVALWDEQNMHLTLLYLVIYVVGTLGLFALLAASIGEVAEDAVISDLEGLGKTKKALAACISIIMFSFIGLPPFAGFFGKYYILYTAIDQEEYLLAAVALISSVIAAYYYLKVVRAMYFCEPVSKIQRVSINIPLLIVIMITIGFILVFSLL